MCDGISYTESPETEMLYVMKYVNIQHATFVLDMMLQIFNVQIQMYVQICASNGVTCHKAVTCHRADWCADGKGSHNQLSVHQNGLCLAAMGMSNFEFPMLLVNWK